MNCIYLHRLHDLSHRRLIEATRSERRLERVEEGEQLVVAHSLHGIVAERGSGAASAAASVGGI